MPYYFELKYSTKTELVFFFALILYMLVNANHSSFMFDNEIHPPHEKRSDSDLNIVSFCHRIKLILHVSLFRTNKIASTHLEKLLCERGFLYDSNSYYYSSEHNRRCT